MHIVINIQFTAYNSYLELNRTIGIQLVKLEIPINTCFLLVLFIFDFNNQACFIWINYSGEHMKTAYVVIISPIDQLGSRFLEQWSLILFNSFKKCSRNVCENKHYFAMDSFNKVYRVWVFQGKKKQEDNRL